MNKIQILGTITRDLELKYTQSGTAIASFGIAYNESRKQPDGTYGDIAHFFDVTAFGKKAETLNQWFRKGSKILIDGSLDFQSWMDQNQQKRSKVSIKLNDFDFIDKKDSSQPSSQHQQHGQQQQNYQQNNANTPPPSYQTPTQQQSYQAPHGQVPIHQEQIPAIDVDEDPMPF